MNGILLDTSFILPSFGIRLGKKVDQALEKLMKLEEKITPYYSTFNLLEAMLVIIREVRRNRVSVEQAVQMLNDGVLNVTLGLTKIKEPYSIYSRAFELYFKGHRDIIDDILVALALENKVKLLTLDRKLRKFLSNIGLEQVTILPSEL